MRASFGLSAVLLLIAGGLTGCLGNRGDEPTAPASAPAAPVAANVTTVDDTNVTSAFTGQGAMMHTHDYWLGRERVTLMDADVDVDAFTALGFTFFDVASGTPGVGGAFIQLPDGAIVYEGSGKLEFTATWNSPTVTGMTLRYRSAAGNDFSEPQPLTSGAALVVPITPEMSDMPHAKSSRWAFLATPGAGQSVVGTMHVKVDIVRMRDITLFPPHPDLFAGAHQLTLFEGSATSNQQDMATRFAGFLTGSAKAAPEPGVGSQKVVPMNTLAMMANVTIMDATSNLGEVQSVNFTVKTADSNGFRAAHLVKSDPATKSYTFAWLVDMRQTDSPYAKQSQWRFDLRVTSNVGPTDAECSGCAQTKTDYKLVVSAYDAALDDAKPLPSNQRGG